MNNLMQGLTVHHLQFKVKAINTIRFGDQPGSAIRGALYQALANHFCSNSNALDIVTHQAYCPVCWLLKQEDPEHDRGQNIPRAMTIQPPLKQKYIQDEEFSFGLTLVGQARDLTLYLIRAVMMMSETGIGRGRSQFKLLAVSEYSPLLDATRPLLEDKTIKQPTLYVNHSRIVEAAQSLDTQSINLEFLTPLRLTANKKLLKTPEPKVFVQRLIERCQALVSYYAEDVEKAEREVWRDLSFSLVEKAERLKVAYDNTQWIETWSGSRRQQRYTPISGLVGTTHWEGDLTELNTWFLWGQSLHVGKNAVKGNGWYRIVK